MQYNDVVLELIVSACEACHRPEENRAEFTFDESVLPTIYSVGINPFTTRTTVSAEAMLMDLQLVWDHLLKHPLEHVTYLRENTNYSYETLLYLLYRFIKDLEKYPEGEVLIKAR